MTNFGNTIGENPATFAVDADTDISITITCPGYEDYVDGIAGLEENDEIDLRIYPMIELHLPSFENNQTFGLYSDDPILELARQLVAAKRDGDLDNYPYLGPIHLYNDDTNEEFVSHSASLVALTDNRCAIRLEEDQHGIRYLIINGTYVTYNNGEEILDIPSLLFQGFGNHEEDYGYSKNFEEPNTYDIVELIQGQENSDFGIIDCDDYNNP